MSVGFCAVQWNRDKIVYDVVLVVGVWLFLAVFFTIGKWINPPKDELAAIDLSIRAFGCCAFVMLTVILCIGPLARIDRRFLPLLYNRRHFGVLTFLIAVAHAWFMVQWFIVADNMPYIVEELTKGPITASSSDFRSRHSAWRHCWCCL